MKRISQITLPFIVMLTTAVPAFAQEISVDPCDTSANTGTGGPGGGSNAIKTKLCGLAAQNTGGLIAKVIIGIIIVATVISLFFLILGGIRWILSGGDKGKVDAARQTIVAAIVGLIITFLAYFIIKVVLGLFGLNINQLSLPNLAQP